MALTARDSEQVTVAATAIGFTAAKALHEKVIRAFVSVETAQVRINTKNTPTAGGTEGSPIKNPNDEFYVTGYSDLKNFLAIRTGAVSGVLTVIYEGEGG